jgi:hypothetical protein
VGRASVVVAVSFGVAAWGQQGSGARNLPGSAVERTAPAQWTGINPVTALTAGTFAAPGANDRPWVRLNMPESADPAELQAEIEDLHNKGIAGVEVGQGAFPNDAQLVALLTRANALGIKVSLSHGPTQNPAGYSMDDDNARKTLVFGNAVVDAGGVFDGAIPAAHPPARPQFGPPLPVETVHHRTTLVAVLAYRCTASPCSDKGAAELDASSVIDLTAMLTDKNSDGVLGGTTAGKLRWTVPAQPAGAQWEIVTLWARGVFAQPDPFSDEGLKDLIKSMDTGLSAQAKALLKANGGDIFYDSHSVDRGSPDEIWTNRMAEEFKARKGYDLVPHMAGLFADAFSFSDGTAARVRDDLYAVRGDLWIEKQVRPLNAWARGLNEKVRIQPEGEMSSKTAINEQIEATTAIDRPEHESLFTNDEVDNYLPIASANHMTGNTWYSTECCAALNLNYAQTLQDVTIRMHKSYAGGIVKLVYHVYPYRDSPTAHWPGYHNFPPAGFSNAWGRRDPDWMDAKLYNDYFARNEQVLTQGRAKTDVAVYMQNYIYPLPQMVKGGFRMWRDTGLQEAGYTRDYLDPTLLSYPNAVVTGKRLAVDGPAYRAFIIDSEQEWATDPVKTSMPLEVARRILGYARAGLPVIVVGAAPDRTPGLGAGSDEELKQVIHDLLAEPSVSRVAREADVPGKLKERGIHPAAEPVASSPMLSVHRRDAATKTDYYFLYNQGAVSPKGEPANLFEPATGTPLDMEVSLEGRGSPYLLNAWSGKITPIAEYTASGDRVTVRVRLSRDNAELIALSEQPGRFGVAAPRVHVTGTDARGAVAERGAVVIRATQSGTVTTRLSDGKTVTSNVGDVPAAIDLTQAKWDVNVEDWQPAHPFADTVGVAAAETRKTPLTVQLEGLKGWPEIPELQSVSGVGTYVTHFDLPADWNAADGATLSLGEVFDSFTLAVNGKPVAVDQLSAEAEVGPYLAPGRNTITVRVATTLNNRLAKLDAGVAKRGLMQPSGLVGPVVITPYQQVRVGGAGAAPTAH